MKTGVARVGRLLLALTREQSRSVRLPLSELAVLDFYTDGDAGRSIHSTTAKELAWTSNATRPLLFMLAHRLFSSRRRF